MECINQARGPGPRAQGQASEDRLDGSPNIVVPSEEPWCSEPSIADVYQAIESKNEARAEQFAAQLVSRRPYDPESYVVLADAFSSQLKFEYAEQAARAALSLDPFNIPALVAVGTALAMMRRYEDAKPILDAVLRRTPSAFKVHWVRSFCNLATYNFVEGFRDYEYGYVQAGRKTRGVPHRRWRGERADVLFVHGEQGLGDQIMFSRFISKAANLCGGRVVVETDLSLVSLFEDLADRVWAQQADGSIPVAHDAHISLLSLPFVLGTDHIDGSPYINPGSVRCDLAGARVGLCWSGNPGYALDADRSLTLEEVRCFEGVAPFCLLQPGGELPFGMPRIYGHDMKATAEVISGLDLVVSVDTAVAHLAGAMGKECWLIAPKSGEWRWGVSGPKSPWYDSVEVFRSPGLDRSIPIKRIKARLHARYGSAGGNTKGRRRATRLQRFNPECVPTEQ